VLHTEMLEGDGRDHGVGVASRRRGLTSVDRAIHCHCGCRAGAGERGTRSQSVTPHRRTPTVLIERVGQIMGSGLAIAHAASGSGVGGAPTGIRSLAE